MNAEKTSGASASGEIGGHREIPALDGLRAIAVAGVILVHINPDILPGGFVGVDVFFALSGFLITSIIHKDLLAGEFSFREFYLRRVQRLLPNAALTVAATVAFLLLFFSRGIENQAGQHGIWTLLNLSNFFAWKFLGGYWGDSAESMPLTHFWSLGIEEQFYLFFPISFFFLFWIFGGKQKGKILMTTVLALASVSLLFAIHKTFQNPVSAFYLPHFRFWELLLGSALALFLKPFVAKKLPQEKGATGKTILGMLGLLSIIGSYFLFSDKTPFPGWAALVPVLGSLLVIFAIATGNGTLSRILSLRPFVAAGKCSYSLYLWHWPAITLGKSFFEFEYPICNAIAGGISGILLGVAAYYLVERPLRKRGKGRAWRLGTIAILFLTALAICLKARSNMPHAPLRFEPVYYAGNLYDPRHGGRALPVVLEGEKKNVTGRKSEIPRYQDVHFLEFASAPPGQENEKNTGFEKRFGETNSPRILFAGDSQANMYSYEMEEICRKNKWNVFFNVFLGSKMFYENSESVRINKADIEISKNRADKLRELCEKWRPDILILSERWDLYSFGVLENGIDDFLEKFPLSKTRIVILQQIPIWRFDRHQNMRRVVAALATKDGGLPAMRQSLISKRCAENLILFERMEKKHPKMILLRPDKLFTKPDGSVHYAEEQKFYYMDSGHLSLDGARLARPLFESSLKNILRAQKQTPASGK